MLRDIRRLSSNWLGKIIMGVVMGLLIVSFAVWGIGDIFRGFGQSTVAKIGGTEISIEQFRQLYTERLQQIGRQIGRPLTTDQARAFGIDRQVLQQVVVETSLNEQAKRLGLAQSDADVVKSIARDPAFQGPSGAFDPARFAQIIRQAGFTEQRFIAEQRSAALRRQITGTVAEGVTPSATLMDAIHRFQNEERSISYIRLGAAQAGTIDAPSQETLATYFEENKAAFRAPEFRKIAIVTVTPEEIAKWTEVSDDDARKAFEERKARFVKPEQREVSQIVFPTIEEANAAREKLVGGTSFADLAKERQLSAADVELGLLAKSSIADTAVADAVFALPLNEISQPIKGTFGYALAKVTKIEAGVTPAYEALAAEIKREVALERARAKVEDQRNHLEDERGGGSNIADAATKLGLPLINIEAVDRSGRDPNGQPVTVPQGTDVIAQAFASDVGVEADPINFQSGYVWYEVLGITPSRERTLDEVKDQVEARWRSQQVSDRLRDKAKELVGKLDGGAALATEAEALGVKVETAEKFKRTDTVTGLTTAVVRAAFRTPKGSAGASEGGENEQIVFQVADIVTPAFDGASEEANNLKDMLKRMLDEEQIGAYVANLQKEIGVTVNQAAVGRITGAND